MRRAIPIGLSPELREALRELSPDNMSAGVRACIILTRYYEGFTVSQLKSEAEKLIGESLPRSLKQTLMAIILDHPPPPQLLSVAESVPYHPPDPRSLPPPIEATCEVPSASAERGEGKTSDPPLVGEEETPAPPRRSSGNDPFADMGEDV